MSHTPKRKILFVGEAVTLAHVVRPLTLARSLDRSGYEIIFASDSRYCNIVGDIEFDQEEIFTIPNDYFLNAIVNGKTGYTYEILEKYVQNDLSVIKATDPDIIVGDFRLSLMISCKLASKRYINITNAYWSPHSVIDYFPIPEHPFSKKFGIKFSEKFFNMFSRLIFSMINSPWNRLLKKYNLPSVGSDIRNVFSQGDFVVYADIPDLYSLKENIPFSQRFIGPVLWAPEVNFPDWWGNIPFDKKVVYVNLGSSGNKDIIPIVCKILNQLSLIGIIALTGGKQSGIRSNNLFFADYLPGDQVAEFSDLVICNGGSPTTYQALSKGVPVLGLVTNMDQCLNMHYLENYGIGLMMRNWAISEKGLKLCINKLLAEKKYRRKAVQFQTRIFEYCDSREHFSTLVAQCFEEKEAAQGE